MSLEDNIKESIKSIKPSVFDIGLSNISDLNINEDYFAEHGIDDLFKSLTDQNNLLIENNNKLLSLLTKQEIRASKSNKNWTILTITITIVLAIVPFLREDDSQKILLEMQEQRRLNTLKANKNEQLHQKSIFLLDQLIQNQTTAKENFEKSEP